MNILTADKKQPGFGDLVSNWYTALVLKKKNRWLTVNFYLSEPFRKNFKKVEPKFEMERATEDMPQIIDGIRVFSINPTFFSGMIKEELSKEEAEKINEKFKIKIYEWINEYWVKSRLENHTCTLAFTTTLVDITRAFDSTSYDYYHAAAGFYVLEAVQERSTFFSPTVSPRFKISPFIVFDYFQDTGNSRYYGANSSTKQFSTNKDKRGIPVYGMRASFANGAIFISKEDSILEIPRYVPTVDYLGYAYAANPDSVRRYLSLVEQFARDNPNAEKVLVIVPSHPSLFREGSHTASDLKRLKLREIAWQEREQTGNLHYEPSPESKGILYRYRANDLKNLYLLHFPSGISFKDVAAIMKAANLPVLVTGTLSLSQALQYDRVIIYEALRHHRGFGKLPTHRGDGTKPSFASEIEQTLTDELHRVDGVPPELAQRFKVVFPTSAQPRADAQDATKDEYDREVSRNKPYNDAVFDVTNGQNRVPTEFLSGKFYNMFSIDHEKFAERAIGNYRKNLKGGFLFDRVLDYCDIARGNFEEIRERELKNKSKPLTSDEKQFFQCKFEESIGGPKPKDCKGVPLPR